MQRWNDIPPILWLLILGFLAASVQAVRTAETPRDILPQFLGIIGAAGLRQRSPVLYWCGVAVVAVILALSLLSIAQALIR